jgi:tetratricopeptide (TPR) repeat protein
MKLRKYYILIISLLAALITNAQSVSDVVNFANAQFREGNYQIAAREYNRAFFFGYEHVDVVSLQIGHCYSELEDYTLAASFYDRAYKYSSSDSIKNESVLGKAYCLLLQNKNLQAIEELFNLSEGPIAPQLAQMHYLKGIAYYNLKDDSLAYKEFYAVLDVSGETDSLQTALTSEFKKVNRYQRRYNPMLSYIMSAFIPGSGQISVGAYKEGINSMVLVAGLAIIAIQIIKSFSFLDAAITLLPWVQRYYMGGMDKAKILAISKIEEKRYLSYQKIINLTTPPAYR